MTDLSHALRDWKPAETYSWDRVEARQAAAFTALLDLCSPTGPVLPPLWHWFHFHDPVRRGELGDDGHPREAAFLPPIPHRRRMVAGGRVRWSGAIRTGDKIERRSAVRDVAVKRGRSGAMAFVTVGHEFRREGELLVDEEQDLVYRSQPPGTPRPVARPEPPTAFECDPRFEFDTDPVTLFQFSALTGNSHRIHYDHPYTTEVEGYPDLVVHGPLLALLLLEIPRREGSTVDSFTYRLSRPAFAGARIAVGRGPDGELSAGAIGAPPSITGVITEKA